VADQAIVSETEKGALQLALHCMVSEATDIVAYVYISSSKGEILTKNIDRLKDVFGWDGMDPFWFEDTNLSGIQFDITVEDEEYEGKIAPKVTWINRVGDTAGNGMGRSADRSAVLAKYGSRLRALKGGKPAARPAPAAKTPQSTSATVPQPAPVPHYAEPPTSTNGKPSKATYPPSSMQEVWEVLCKVGTEKGHSQEDCNTAWEVIVSRIGDQDTMTPEQWGETKAYAEKYFNA